MRKRKRLFWILRIASLVLLGLAVAVVIAVSKINVETLRKNVISMLENAAGVPVEIAGDVEWKLSLRPHIVVNKVRISNSEWAKHKYAVESDHIDIRLNLLSLFNKSLIVENVKVYDTNVNIEKNVKGEFSLPMLNNRPGEDAVEQPKPQTKYAFKDFGLGGVELRNIKINVADYKTAFKGLSFRYFERKSGPEYSGWIRPDDKAYPFIISCSEYNAERMVYPMRVAVSTSGDALIADLLLSKDTKVPVDFSIKGNILDDNLLNFLLAKNVGRLPNVSLDISGGLHDNKIELRDSVLVINGNKISVSGVYDGGLKVPSIKLNVKSARINIMEIVPGLYGHWVRPNRDLNVFKDMGLYGKDLLKYDLDVDCDIKQFIVYRDMNLRNIKMKANLKQGKGRVDTSLVFAGGNIRMVSNVDTGANGDVFLQAALDGRGIKIGNLMNEIRIKDLISDLPMNVMGYFEANGKDMSEIMHSITGPALAYSTGQGYAHARLVEYVYGADFLTALRHGISDLFSSEKKHNQMTIKSVVANLKIRNGVIETKRGIAAETNVINVGIAGNLNLGDETMDLALVTVPVRGLKISLTGTFTNALKITGNLAEPDVSISGGAIAGKVASSAGIGLLLAPFTGGLSLVGGVVGGFIAGELLENWLSDDNPVQTAMESGAPVQRDDPEWLDMPVESLVERLIK